MDDTKKSVSIWLYLTDGPHAGKFALQRRSEKNRNFPFVCQPTWAGKIEPGESVLEAVRREGAEEMGQRFCGIFDFSNLRALEIGVFERDGQQWEVHNFLGGVGKDALGTVNLHSEAMPEFVFAGRSDEVFPIGLKKSPQDHIILFEDQYVIFNAITRNIQ